MTERRSNRSARTPANGPNVNQGIERSARASPTAAGLPVSWLTYTARAMNVTNDPASDTQSESQKARSSRFRSVPNTDAVRWTNGAGMPSIIQLAQPSGRKGGPPQAP